MRDMPNRLLILILTLLFCSNNYGQTINQGSKSNSRNTVYGELLGSAGYLYNVT